MICFDGVRRSLVPLFFASLVPLFFVSLVPLFFWYRHFSCKLQYKMVFSRVFFLTSLVPFFLGVTATGFTVTGSPHVAQPRAEVPTVELSLKGSLLGFLEA